jgi:hypothetical protein
MRLEAARVGQEPKKRTSEEFGLATDYRFRSKKSRAVGLQTEHCDAAGLQHPYLCFELRRAFAQLGGTEFAGGGRHPVRQVRDAYAESEQNVLLGGQEDRLGESTGTEQLPEPIPRPGEMQAEVARERPGIDPTEEHAQIRTDQISDSLLHGARTYAPAEVPWVQSFSSLSGLVVMDTSTEVIQLIHCRRRAGIWRFSSEP